MSLPRRATTGTFDELIVNVWDTTTKTIIFTGNASDAANFIGIPYGHMHKNMSKGHKIKKTLKVKPAKQNPHI